MNNTNRETLPEVEFPLCRCKSCKGVFRDPYEIYPGPTLCPACNAREREEYRQRTAYSGRRRD